MTRAQTKREIDSLDFYLQNHTDDYGEESHTAMMMAIKALEQQTCEDAVSRQVVLENIKELKKSPWFNDDINGVRIIRKEAVEIVEDLCIKNLPSVNSQPKTKWIPVSERLPEDYELVLFSTKTDRVFEGRYFDDNTDRQWYAFRDETFAWNNVVTAWMPLPQPYEPQERSEKE